MTALHIASILFDQWVVPYQIVSFILTDSGLQVVSKGLRCIVRSFGARHLRTTALHLQTNDQAKHYNKKNDARLGRYAVQHHCDWDLFAKLITYVYNTEGHCTMR